MHYLEAQIRNMANQSMDNDEGLIEGSWEFMAKNDLHPWRQALVAPEKNGLCKVGVINTQPFPITIPCGSYYGNFTFTCENAQTGTRPGRIAIIEPICSIWLNQLYASRML